MRAAIYARVSTERQERQQTIESQLTVLRAWAVAQGHVLGEALFSVMKATAARASTDRVWTA